MTMGLTCLVNGLDPLIERSQLVLSAPCDVDLSNCGLGIDASYYIRQLYKRESIKSSLSSALGGIPTSFKTEVENDLATFKRWGTHLKFVFDGLDLRAFNNKDERTWKVDPMIAKRKAAWDAWTKLAEKGRNAEANERQELAKETREAFAAGISLAYKIDDSDFDSTVRRQVFDGNSA